MRIRKQNVEWNLLFGVEGAFLEKSPQQLMVVLHPAAAMLPVTFIITSCFTDRFKFGFDLGVTPYMR